MLLVEDWWDEDVEGFFEELADDLISDELREVLGGVWRTSMALALKYGPAVIATVGGPVGWAIAAAAGTVRLGPISVGWDSPVQGWSNDLLARGLHELDAADEYGDVMEWMSNTEIGIAAAAGLSAAMGNPLSAALNYGYNLSGSSVDTDLEEALMFAAGGPLAIGSVTVTQSITTLALTSQGRAQLARQRDSLLNFASGFGHGFGALGHRDPIVRGQSPTRSGESGSAGGFVTQVGHETGDSGAVQLAGGAGGLSGYGSGDALVGAIDMTDMTRPVSDSAAGEWSLFDGYESMIGIDYGGSTPDPGMSSLFDGFDLLGPEFYLGSVASGAADWAGTSSFPVFDLSTTASDWNLLGRFAETKRIDDAHRLHEWRRERLMRIRSEQVEARRNEDWDRLEVLKKRESFLGESFGFTTQQQADAAAPQIGFTNGLWTGGKALTNAGSDTLWSFADGVVWLGSAGQSSLGDNPFNVAVDPLSDLGYGSSYMVGRGLTEVYFGMGVGALAAPAKFGRLGRFALHADFANNAKSVNDGLVDAWDNGLGWGNGAQIVGGAFGVGGNVTTGGRYLNPLNYRMPGGRGAAHSFVPHPAAFSLGMDHVDDLTPATILFGQKRIAERFRVGSGAGSQIEGRLLSDVTADLRSGFMSTDDLPIQYFVTPAGEAVTINNRGLAAIYDAGLRPTWLEEVPLSQVSTKELDRLLEPPVLRDQVLPGPMIPVTRDKAGTDIIRVITTPENIQ